MEENEISYKIRGCIFKIYNSFGPGLLESVYEAALVYEMQNLDLRTQIQVPIPVFYEEMNKYEY